VVSSNPLLLLDNRFLGAAPRALESWPEPTQRFLNPPNIFPVKNLSFEKRAAQHPPSFKASQGLSCRFSKPFGKFKFSHQMGKNLLIQCKIKATFKFFKYLPDSLLTKTHHTIPLFSQLKSLVPVPLRA
jgi:hypothetical protein